MIKKTRSSVQLDIPSCQVAQMNSASLYDAVVQTAGQQRQEDSSKDKHQLQSIFKVQRSVTADDIQLLMCKH